MDINMIMRQAQKMQADLKRHNLNWKQQFMKENPMVLKSRSMENVNVRVSQFQKN